MIDNKQALTIMKDTHQRPNPSNYNGWQQYEQDLGTYIEATEGTDEPVKELNPIDSIKDLINSWDKYNPEIVRENEDGVFVVMDDIEDRFLFYIFVNPLDGKIQVNEIDGFRKRYESVEQIQEILNN